MDYTCLDIAKMIDHSLLRPELTEEQIIKGCEIAKKYSTAAVCCPPSAIALVKKHLDGSDVKPTTVAGFPHGYNKTETKVFEAEQAIKDGAVELDMVINIGKLKSRYYLMILVKVYYAYKYQRLIPARCYAARPSPDAKGR